MTPPLIPPVIEPPRKTVKYSLTRGDILRWQFYSLSRNRVILAFAVIIGVLTALNDLRTPELAKESIGVKIICVIFVTLCILLFVCLSTMLMLALLIMVKKHRGLLGEHELEIRHDGLVERTDVNESLHRWGGFHKIVVKSRYLYIYVTDNNVHIVPRRCFASEHEEQAFRAELETRIKAARL